MTYEMRYGADLDLKRVEDFFDGKLSPNDMAVLAQDVVEAGLVFGLGPDIHRLVVHCVNNNLCTITGAYKQ